MSASLVCVKRLTLCTDSRGCLGQSQEEIAQFGVWHQSQLPASDLWCNSKCRHPTDTAKGRAAQSELSPASLAYTYCTCQQSCPASAWFAVHSHDSCNTTLLLQQLCSTLLSDPAQQSAPVACCLRCSVPVLNDSTGLSTALSDMIRPNKPDCLAPAAWIGLFDLQLMPI